MIPLLDSVKAIILLPPQHNTISDACLQMILCVNCCIRLHYGQSLHHGNKAAISTMHCLYMMMMMMMMIYYYTNALVDVSSGSSFATCRSRSTAQQTIL